MAGYLPIADYAAIGDCHTAALVSRDGSIDWYCPGRFDAPALFCRLLDADRGGYWRVAPSQVSQVERRYRPHTNVLETTYAGAGGRLRLTDWMTLPSRAGRIVRLVEALDGEVDVQLDFKPTPDYARRSLTLEDAPGNGLIVGDHRHTWTLTGVPVKLERQPRDAWSVSWRMRRGARHWLVLADGSLTAQPTPAELDRGLAETSAFWQSWADRCTYRGPYRDVVERSALVLKLLTYEPSGALVAAPTTSLPEALGGVRNWDYRYTWLRDSALILYALMTIGYEVEADDFFSWAAGTIAARRPQIMYGIDGETSLPETTLDQLAGYQQSRPVRVGNAAAGQEQLDIYGEIVRSAYFHEHAIRKHSRRADAPHGTREHWDLLSGLVERAAEGWQRPDNGIWEVRGGPQHFLYSKVMCWVALDRGLRLAKEQELTAPVARWSRIRDQIRQAILDQGYDARIGAFTQALGSPNLDATALTIPLVGFLPATDPRCRSTAARIQAELTQNGLVHRYRSEDGLPGGEAAFVMCSFWLVDALALGGDVDAAEALFQQLIGYANDLGLLSEEVDPASRQLLGNYPQGFSHLALIVAAVNLAKAHRHGAEHEPETEAERAPRARAAAAHGRSAST